MARAAATGRRAAIRCAGPATYQRLTHALGFPAEWQEEHSAALEQAVELARWGEPDEIARAILWLASGEASFATGTMMTVVGGASIW